MPSMRRIDLTPAKCQDVEITVQWGDLTTRMSTVPLQLPPPSISGVQDLSPNLIAVEVRGKTIGDLRWLKYIYMVQVKSTL